MKKLLVLALAVMLILSLTVVASAATFDPYVGGRITWAYISSDSTKNDPVTLNNSGIKMLLQGKIKDEATGTWGTIGAKIDGWPNDGALNGPNAIYDFGINNIGGSNFSLWYTNWENQNMKRGQGRVYDVGPVQYHEDPMFDHAPGNVIGIDYKTDNVIVNIGYVPDKMVGSSLFDATGTFVPVKSNRINAMIDKNEMLAAATFKFDGGDVHFGYYDGKKDVDADPYDLDDDDDTLTQAYESTEINVGAEFKLGFGSIKVDYVTMDLGDDAYGNSPKDDFDYDGGDIVQAAVFFDELKFDVTLISDSEYKFRTDGGMGYQIRYTGINDGKVILGYKAMEADNKADESLNFTDAYIGFKYGIFDTRIGVGTKGEANNNDFVYASLYAGFW